MENILIIGDLNCRIGSEQKFDTVILLEDVNSSISSQRCSKDNLVNGRGKQVLELFDGLGLIVLNGRSFEIRKEILLL